MITDTELDLMLMGISDPVMRDRLRGLVRTVEKTTAEDCIRTISSYKRHMMDRPAYAAQELIDRYGFTWNWKDNCSE